MAHKPKRANRREKKKAPRRDGKGRVLRLDEMSPRTSALVAVVVIIASVALYNIWASLSIAAWSPDSTTRYFDVLGAMRSPGNFTNAKTGLLWSWLYVLPLQMGSAAVPIFTSVLLGVAAFGLYKGCRLRKKQFAFAIIPLFLFQPFLFGMGRDALVEPLGAVVIASGYYFLSARRWWLFGLTGALLPLVRPELIVLQPFWLVPLLRAKQWKVVPTILAGTAVWAVIMSLSGNWDSLFAPSLLSDFLISKFSYVVGPIVFMLALAGLVRRVLSGNSSWFVEGQLFAGLGFYCIASGTGFHYGLLESLTVLAPLVALLAQHGLEHWTAGMATGRNWFNALIVLIAAVIITIFQRHTLFDHHHPSEQVEWLPIIYAATFLVVSVLPVGWLVSNLQLARNQVATALVALVMATVMFYALIDQNPKANWNQEYEVMSKVADLYNRSVLKNFPRLFCSHDWFYKAGELDRSNSKFGELRRAAIDAAPQDAVVIWEARYSSRLRGDVLYEYLENPASGYVRVATMYSEDYTRNASIHIKKERSASNLDYVDVLLRSVPELAEGYRRKAEIYSSEQNLIATYATAEEALKLKPNDAISLMLKAGVMMTQNRFHESVDAFSIAARYLPNHVDVYLQLGTAYYNLQNFDMSLYSYENGLALDPNMPELHYYAGLSLKAQSRPVEACQYFAAASRLGYEPARQELDTYCVGL